MNLQHLRWLTIVVAIVFLVVVQFVAMVIIMPAFGRPYGHAVSIIGFSAGVLFFTSAVFRAVDAIQARLVDSERQIAVLEEREMLAREMHDTFAQVLGYLHLKAEVALGKLARGDTPKAVDELNEIRELSHEAYADVREAILGLRETISPHRDFIDSLREYLRKFSRQAGIAADLEVRGDHVSHLSPEAEVQVMRVIQEALTNVRKHANARRACVSFEQTDAVAITIDDDGTGFDPDKVQQDGRSFGLLTMRERVERAGGQFQILARPGGGTRVHVLFPRQETER